MQYVYGFASVTTNDIKETSFWLMPATPNYVPTGVPYITSKNIKNGQIDFQRVEHVTQEDYEQMSANRKVKKNDLLITMIGTIGEVAIVGDFEEFYGQNLYLVRLDDTIVDRKYFYYFITSPAVRENLVSRKNASSQGYIKAGSIDNLVIPLPELKEQKRISAMLDQFDGLINEIGEGIPAEIEARTRQYEHYRGKLLTFKRKN